MEHQVKRAPLFWINPNLRIHFPDFCVEWFQVEADIIRQEAALTAPNKHIYHTRNMCVLCMTRPDHAAVDVVYDAKTDFENLRLQKWLRETIRNQIVLRAEIVLPRRFHELETKHQLYANKVVVRKLRKNVLGQCSSTNVISLAPFLIIMPQAFTQTTMLHEMAHIKHKHHKKSFWAFLSQLIGEDAKQQKQLQDIVLAKYWQQIQFLMK